MNKLSKLQTNEQLERCAIQRKENRAKRTKFGNYFCNYNLVNSIPYSLGLSDARTVLSKNMDKYFLVWERYENLPCSENDKEKVTQQLQLHIDNFLSNAKQSMPSKTYLPIEIIEKDKFIELYPEYNFLKEFKRIGKLYYEVAIEELVELLMSNPDTYIKGSYARRYFYNESNDNKYIIPLNINFSVLSDDVLVNHINTIVAFCKAFGIKYNTNVNSRFFGGDPKRCFIKIDYFIAFTFQVVNPIFIEEKITERYGMKVYKKNFIKVKKMPFIPKSCLL